MGGNIREYRHIGAGLPLITGHQSILSESDHDFPYLVVCFQVGQAFITFVKFKDMIDQWHDFAISHGRQDIAHKQGNASGSFCSRAQIVGNPKKYQTFFMLGL